MLKSKTILIAVLVCFLNTDLLSSIPSHEYRNVLQQSETVLKDKNGHLLGKIKTRSDGTQEIRDKNGRYLGKYNPKTNITYDKNGHKVGTGNQLAALLNLNAH